MNFSRRSLISGAAALVAQAQQKPKKPVAAIVTMYVDDQRLKSHASVICGRIFEGYSPNNKRVEPRTRIVTMYTDQVPPNDLSRGLAEKHGFRITKTIDEAITNGGDRIAVDAVLFVGEHGNYPLNDKGQKMYPRYELFEQIVQTFRRTRQSVPVFCDKHLSYSWEKAKRMYDWSRELKFPLMAGSSIPVTVRTPELEIPYGARFDHALAVGYGDIDAYGFHTLETLQCMVERRAGGETGIAAVQFVEGDAVWKWRDSEQGRWSAPLLEAALATNSRTRPGRMEDNVKRPVLFLLEYRDGLRAVAYLLQGHASNFLFSAKLRGEQQVRAANFGIVGEGRPLAHFDGLVHGIEEMFVTGKPLYPVERTLLTTGALALLFESKDGGRRETPELRIKYKAPKDTFFQRA
jgi:hypothetical protein